MQCFDTWFFRIGAVFSSRPETHTRSLRPKTYCRERLGITLLVLGWCGWAVAALARGAASYGGRWGGAACSRAKPPSHVTAVPFIRGAGRGANHASRRAAAVRRSATASAAAHQPDDRRPNDGGRRPLRPAARGQPSRRGRARGGRPAAHAGDGELLWPDIYPALLPALQAPSNLILLPALPFLLRVAHAACSTHTWTRSSGSAADSAMGFLPVVFVDQARAIVFGPPVALALQNALFSIVVGGIPGPAHDHNPQIASRALLLLPLLLLGGCSAVLTSLAVASSPARPQPTRCSLGWRHTSRWKSLGSGL